MSYDLRFWFDNLWRWKCGLPEIEDNHKKSPSYEELRESEWSEEFENLMRNRLIMGAMRYGVMGHGSIPKGKPRYDRCNSIRKRLKIYEETGNLEMLADISNFALLLFEERYHPNSHFNSIDDGIHDQIINK